VNKELIAELVAAELRALSKVLVDHLGGGSEWFKPIGDEFYVSAAAIAPELRRRKEEAQALRRAKAKQERLPTVKAAESQEQRARRLFDEMARNIGREAVNHLKAMYPAVADRATLGGNWERSLTNHVRNDINWRMRPLLMALIAVHQEWSEDDA